VRRVHGPDHQDPQSGGAIGLALQDSTDLPSDRSRLIVADKSGTRAQFEGSELCSVTRSRQGVSPQDQMATARHRRLDVCDPRYAPPLKRISNNMRARMRG
jgi:hypothetical protein